MSERTAKVLLASVISEKFILCTSENQSHGYRCFQPHGHPFPYGIFDNAADFQ